MPTQASFAMIEYTDGSTHRVPLGEAPDLPKGWMVIEFTDGTAEVRKHGVKIADLARTIWRKWKIVGEDTYAKTTEELALRLVARG